MIVSRETEEKLRQYDALLHKWQKTINLVSPATLTQSWQRHFVDSLQLLPLIPETAKTLVDMGSGAGFPGLVIAIARPDIAVTLIESDQRKCAFLQSVSRETGVKVRVLNQRLETAEPFHTDVVTARALASLDQLLEYTAPLFHVNQHLTLILPKGEKAQQEIDVARQRHNFSVDTVPSVTAPEAQILVIRQVQPCV